MHSVSRRHFLATAVASGLTVPAIGFIKPRAKIKVAAICTEFTYRSHAHVIIENFLEPYLFNGTIVDPTAEFEVASIYLDQTPDGEMGRGVARDYRIPHHKTIADALTLGGDKLAVDAVLSIGEHGNYPKNDKGQIEYPRKRFFDEVVAVFERSGRTVPVFSDKHLSYRWDWAKEMVDTSKRLGFAFMAGSSVPLAERRPPMEQPEGLALDGAVGIHGGPFESYDFHGLEILQSVVEARKGGEIGVRRVQFLEGDALWNAADEGRWSIALADAAMAAEFGPNQPTLKTLVTQTPHNGQPLHGILIEYVDGLRAAMLRVGSSAIRWNVAVKAQGESTPRATTFNVGPWQNRWLFKALSNAIQTCFRERKSPYPVERTLLTTGILSAAVDSHVSQNRALDTPELATIRYPSIDFARVRENGATWKTITEETPEPKGMHSMRPAARNHNRK